jgi:uncharacterized membrane-anchored protein
MLAFVMCQAYRKKAKGDSCNRGSMLSSMVAVKNSIGDEMFLLALSCLTPRPSVPAELKPCSSEARTDVTGGLRFGLSQSKKNKRGTEHHVRQH